MSVEAKAEKDTLLFANTMTNSQTVTANLDCRGAGHATIRLLLSQELNTNAVGPTISLSESDDTVVTNFATVTADRSAEDLTAKKEVRYEIDLRKRKRYLRLSITTGTATNDNVAAAAVASLSRNQEDPDTTTEMGDDVVLSL